MVQPSRKEGGDKACYFFESPHLKNSLIQSLVLFWYTKISTLRLAIICSMNAHLIAFPFHRNCTRLSDISFPFIPLDHSRHNDLLEVPIFKRDLSHQMLWSQVWDSKIMFAITFNDTCNFQMISSRKSLKIPSPPDVTNPEGTGCTSVTAAC